jgi:hypothetical protein
LEEVKVLAKAGGEGSVVFDSAIALLQGLFPPSAKNKIKLANDTVVLAPLGGYQYVPRAVLFYFIWPKLNYLTDTGLLVETVEPGNDRSMESWTDCPACGFLYIIPSPHTHSSRQAFQKHIATFHGSAAFKEKAQESTRFFHDIKDYVFGRPTTLENIVRTT